MGVQASITSYKLDKGNNCHNKRVYWLALVGSFDDIISSDSIGYFSSHFDTDEKNVKDWTYMASSRSHKGWLEAFKFPFLQKTSHFSQHLPSS